MRRTLATVVALAVVAIACATRTTSAPSATASSLPAAPPADTSITPISLSHPGAEAAAVIERCVAGVSDAAVVAIGEIRRARDAWQYVPIPKDEPSIQSYEPMWIVQLRGTYTFPTPSGAGPGAGVWHDPVCIVRTGESGYINVADDDTSRVTKSLPSPVP